MATAKKGAKNNKTAHVLNLLTAPGAAKEAPAEPTPEEEGVAAVPADPPEAAGRPLTPPVLEVARSNDAQISLQIKDALESELLAETGEGIESPVEAEPPAPMPEPAPTPQPTSSGGKLSQEEIERMLAGGIPEPEPAPAPMPEPAPAPQPAVPEPQPDPEELQIINVMEYLVELKAPRYISMFGLCTCPRCIADVKALTLTNLQPAYVVVPRSEAHGMLTVYESRFNSTVFAQLTRSCKVVMDNPRHNQKFML